MVQDPARRRYVPLQIWRSGYYPGDLECYISDERFVLGRCVACKTCDCDPHYHYDEETKLVPCSQAGTCNCGMRSAHGDTIIIATDGACRNNGYANAEAAIGVFCNINSGNNKSFVLSDARPTNQRAELWAAVIALRMARNMFANGNINRHITEVVIKTDSAYLVNSMTNWVIKWRHNDYTNAKGLPVVNADLLEELDDLCNKLDNIHIRARFWQVPREDNMQADKLANAALDGINWKSFSPYDWFTGGSQTMPFIHERAPPSPVLGYRPRSRSSSSSRCYYYSDDSYY